MKLTRQVLGHSLLCLLVCSHHSLICLLCTARFTRALSCAHSFARSLTRSLWSSWERGFCLWNTRLSISYHFNPLCLGVNFIRCVPKVPAKVKNLRHTFTAISLFMPMNMAKIEECHKSSDDAYSERRGVSERVDEWECE